MEGGGEGEKFILVKLKNICNKKDIPIKYAVFYIYEENGFIEKD